MDTIRGPRQENSQDTQLSEIEDHPEADTIRHLLQSIAAQFELTMGRPEQVDADCARLRQLLSLLPMESARQHLTDFIPLLAKRMGPIALPVFVLLEEAAEAGGNPRRFLEGMLAARDPNLARRALNLADRLAESESLRVDLGLVKFLAARIEGEGCPLTDHLHLEKIARIVRRLPSIQPSSAEPLLDLYLFGKDLILRRLAARLLDLRGEPAASGLSEQLLGRGAYAFLRPYLDYVRTTHLDLLCLIAEPDAFSRTLESLRRAEAACGETLLKEAIAKLGWPRINLGLNVTPYVGISIKGSLPLMVLPDEASLVESCGESRRASEAFLFIAHGGMPAEGRETQAEIDPIMRFRSFNLTHAEVLADILDLAPLTRQKVDRILERMDRIVADFMALFTSATDECTILPSVYRDLKQRILTELEKQIPEPQLSPELTRLVQMFEDPRSLGGVRTLHGLKRYLHQKGLRLGMRLVEMGRGTNRTIDLLCFSRSRSSRSVRRIRYVDFGSESKNEEEASIPLPVALLVDGFGRQLLAGHENFPDVKIFCYGNEVHYYVSFRNHPAFLRVDYSPPLQGGMIDLEYYGVSRYELSAHPNTSLDAIRLFFRRLDFDIRIEHTRIHARFDKERAMDLGAICEKAEILFRLMPYLMEVDWVIGNLDLKNEAKEMVAEAWSLFFTRWGTLQISQVLSSDRRSILTDSESGPTGEHELVWSGEKPYRDRYSVSIPADHFAMLHASLEELGLAAHSPPGEGNGFPLGQLVLERRFLAPLREALKRGEVVQSPDGFCRRPAEQFQCVREGEIFAGILAASDEAVLSAAAVALLVSPLERTLQFCTTGTLNGYEIHHASLSLMEESLGLFALRDSSGMIRFAFFSKGNVLYRRRQNSSAAWECNWSCNAANLALLLRRANYLAPGIKPTLEPMGEKIARVRDGFLHSNPMWRPRQLPGERLVTGARASPGRAIGTILFGTQGRIPDDFDGSVLVAASVRPEDNSFLYRAAGIVSTGGGILSHAGLIAVQFHKPALVISGEWKHEIDGSATLCYRTLEYREEESEVHGFRVSSFYDVRKREHQMREGDLVVLDATEGFLRVLGQDREALALHEGISMFGEAGRLLQRAKDDRQVLVLRGSSLRARHQIEKLLSRLNDPVLARHAVEELLMGKMLAGSVTAREKAQCLSVLLGNRSLGGTALAYLWQMVTELRRRCLSLHERANQQIPISSSALEVLALRLEDIRLHQVLDSVFALLKACGLGPAPLDSAGKIPIDSSTRHKLEELRQQHLSELLRLQVESVRDFRLRHLHRQIERLDLVLATSEAEQEPIRRIGSRIAYEDAALLREHEHRRIVLPADCGFELHLLIGWKAANLAEAERLAGRGLVPSWFVITHKAFEEALNSPLDRIASGMEGVPSCATNLREAIDVVLARTDLNHAQQANLIRSLWNSVVLPAELAGAAVAAYHQLGSEIGNGASPPFVAIRSSARAEDAEIAARAGEFETFLFVRGDQLLLEHLKRAWSGLWTERAIHNRSVLGSGSEEIGGGVIVQRIVWSRVAGVLQTVNVAENDLREIVINVGLGLGEGIVSGTVAADQVLVAKEGDLFRGPLRFRYITSDKRELVAFNERAGFGTTRVETLYHQRLRPALEYVELCELVRAATVLEMAYGYPLDIEFAFEGTRLWILQVRPVAIFLSALRETVDHYPLSNAKQC